MKLSIDTPRVFLPLIKPARYKLAWGGRGSGKSHFFAELLVECCIANPGTRALCVREVQKSLKESAKRLIEDKIDKFGVGSLFDIQQTQIITPGNGVITFAGMQDHTADSIKSYEGFDIAWIEEAQSISKRSLMLLRPTMRKAASTAYPAGAEMWFSENPVRKTDPVDALLRGPNPPPDAIVVKANWSENPFFPAALGTERNYDLGAFPERYQHVWEGDYMQVMEGAYYAQSLAMARAQKRIVPLSVDPNMQVWTFWDIGTRDHTAIWCAQFIGSRVYLIDHYEAAGQPLATHLNWLRDNGYEKAICVLPHDGSQVDHFTAERYVDHIRAAGFESEVIKNQGKGAAMLRIDALRRLFPSIWIDPEHCEGGIDALSSYHERKDEKRDIGLGPEHDWSSHSCDALGLLAVAKPILFDRGRDIEYDTGYGDRQSASSSTGY